MLTVHKNENLVPVNLGRWPLPCHCLRAQVSQIGGMVEEGK